VGFKNGDFWIEIWQMKKNDVLRENFEFGKFLFVKKNICVLFVFPVKNTFLTNPPVS
jgi:hypothetical protein